MMHTPGNLASATIFDWAKKAAGTLLLHVCALGPDEMRAVLSSGVAAVPDRARRHAQTVEAEEGLDIPPSIYFFVGRCRPRPVGTIAIAITSDDLLADDGHVSPFDTGGLYHDKLLLPWRAYPPATKKSYLEEHSAALAGFKSYFVGFLSTFFSEIRSYWDRPDEPIDNIAFEIHDDWRNWTFEARIAERVTLSNAQWYFSHEAESHYSSLLADGLIDPLPNSRYQVVAKPFEKAEADAIAVALG